MKRVYFLKTARLPSMIKIHFYISFVNHKYMNIIKMLKHKQNYETEQNSN